MGYESDERAEARVELRDYLINTNESYNAERIVDLFVNSKGANMRYSYEARRRTEADLFNQ